MEIAVLRSQLRVDLLRTSRALSDVALDFRASWPGPSIIVLDDEPMSLDEIADAGASS
jgi:hypothetical protein